METQTAVQPEADVGKDANRVALMQAIAAANVAYVVATFEGSGDDGNTVEFEFGMKNGGPKPIGLFEGTQVTIDGKSVDLLHALEEEAISLISQNHLDGYEDGLGGEVRVTFQPSDTPKGTIYVAHSYRVETLVDGRSIAL
ncbi:MAG: hypothetical protein ING75_13695 [Rhodocyclaceae bacterium]|nr:hypothetical protein [Rhodocyclaceae bacterium]